MAEKNEVTVEKPEESTSVENINEKKKGKGGIGCLVFLVVLLITPILVAVGMYFLSHDFELFANGVLGQLPGGMGEHFASKPTRADELRTVKEAADFLVRLENVRIVDKLKMIEAKDARFYDELVKELLRLNPNKTRAVLEEMRKTGAEQDLLSEIKGDVQQEELEAIKKHSEYLVSLPLPDAVEEIGKIAVEYGGHEKIASYIEHMSDREAFKILYALDNQMRNRIFALLSEAKAKSIKNAYRAEQRKNQELEQLAILMKRERGSVVAKELQKYPEEDQIFLLRKLGPRVAGLALSHYEDSEKSLDLIAKIKGIEISERGRDEVTKDLINSLKIYRDYDDNIKELVDVYLKMDTEKVVKTVKDMMINPATDRVYRLDNGDTVEFSDVDLIVDVLRRFPEKKVAEILSKLDDVLTSELTRRLALPK